MNTKSKIINVAIYFLICAIAAAISSCFAFHNGKKEAKVVAVDFNIEDFKIDEREPKYKFMPAELSNYICDLCDELKLDSDLVVAHLLVENSTFNPDAIHRNDNGTLDLGMFQLNDKYLWTTFKNDYWSFENVELNPFNWKHNSYIALHLMADLQKELKVQDDVIMAYNGGRGAVMNGNIKPATLEYLKKVKNNLWLLKHCEGSING